MCPEGRGGCHRVQCAASISIDALRKEIYEVSADKNVLYFWNI